LYTTNEPPRPPPAELTVVNPVPEKLDTFPLVLPVPPAPTVIVLTDDDVIVTFPVRNPPAPPPPPKSTPPPPPPATYRN
jgi:hypothetical protein